MMPSSAAASSCAWTDLPCVIMERCVLGIDPVSWAEDGPAENARSDVLRFAVG